MRLLDHYSNDSDRTLVEPLWSIPDNTKECATFLTTTVITTRDNHYQLGVGTATIPNTNTATVTTMSAAFPSLLQEAEASDVESG